MDPVIRHYIVHGRVQGVGFRASTMEKAASLDIRGWVRNQPDGNVEILAAGGEQALLSFYHWLQTGPSMASVEFVQMSVVEAASMQETLPLPFEIRRQFSAPDIIPTTIS